MNSSIRKFLASLMIGAILFSQIWVIPAHAFFGFGDLGIADEKEMGRKFEVLIRSQLPLVEDPEVSLYVKKIVDRISAAIPPQPFEFTTGVVLHNSLNAFAVPGGHVFIFTGLIMQLDNEAELAGIMAHEMAHVTERHVAERINRGKYLTLATLLGAVAGVVAGGEGGAALAAGAFGAGQAAMLNYSRMDETEADDMGYQYLVAAGYPPLGMAGGFMKIREKSAMIGGGSVPTYLSTHPHIGSRITSVIAKSRSGPQTLNNRKVDNTQFKRVQALLWARYGTIQAARHRFAADKSPLALMGTAMLFARENKIQEASAAFDVAMAASPKDPLILREAGAFHYRKGDTARANTLLTTAMKLDPRDYMAQFFYARLLDETGQSLKAEPYYHEILRVLPEDREVHYAYARSLGRSGKNFQAYLHMAYNALYGNDERRTKQYFTQAKDNARNDTDNAAIARFNDKYKERQEIWDEGL